MKMNLNASQQVFKKEKLVLRFTKDSLLWIKLQKIWRILSKGITTSKNSQILHCFLTPEMLQKKVWIQINRLNRTICVYTGDIVGMEHEKHLEGVLGGEVKERNGWDNEKEVFSIPKYNENKVIVLGAPKNNLKQYEPSIEAKFFSVNIIMGKPIKNKISSQNINNFISIKLFNSGRLYNAVINENPSLLKPEQANIEAMPKEIKILFNYLFNLNLTKLPDYEVKHGKKHQNKLEYLNFKGFQNAIHHSLVTPYCSTADGTPFGIMNHLYKMKCKKQFQLFNIMKENREIKKKEDILKEIYSQRSGYIRLELNQHEGLGPGSMAVVEIWPPFHCSSIHNHGQSYGLIKVLSGSIRVQNFSELTFDQNSQKPYQQNQYYQDQYTWLSQQSFGIHRLINVHPQTCLTLQAYYHNDNTAQFFSVVSKNNQGENLYIEYYPQHDWKNYLNLVNQNNKEAIDQKDIDFIKKIIQKYDLRDQKGKIDSSFHNLAIILKREYDYLMNYTSLQI